MKKIMFIAFFASTVLLMFSLSLQASSSTNKINIDCNKINKIRFHLNSVFEKVKVIEPTAVIGFTDSCGNCHEYNFYGSWSNVWYWAEYIQQIYNTGYCGEVFQLICGA